MAYSKEEIDRIFDEVLDDISQGSPAYKAIKGKLSSATFYDILEKDAEKANKYKELTGSKEYLERIKCVSNKRGSKAVDINDYRSINARVVNMAKFPNSSFYIFGISDLGMFKLGVSQNIDRRIRDISNAMPFNVEVLYTRNIKNAYIFERYIHNLYKGKYIKNEWFRLLDIDLRDIINECEKWEM